MAFGNRVMPLSSEEDEFVEVASAALPRIVEIIAAFPAEHRAGALAVAEHRYMQAARDFGCTQAETERWVAAIMRKLRTRMEEKSD
jgi:DNA-directed RNA polymerase specialized sigma24 family protein